MIPARTIQQRALIAAVEVMSLSVWFSATAVLPGLRAEWGIGSAGAVWLTAAVQVGFAVGAITSSVLGLADRPMPQRLLAASALCAATSTTALALFADGPAAAVPLRFLTGMFLAGVYPVGLKLMASWSPSAQRGQMFGVVLAALTLGSALPHLMGGFGPLPWRTLMLAAAGATAAGAVVALTMVRPGPHLEVRATAPNHRRAIDYRCALAVFAQAGPRRACLGYIGHMWELYALWTWLAMYVTTGRDARGDTASSTGLIVFVAIGVAGIVGCLLGGLACDRFGPSPAAVWALIVSGACCVASPLFYCAPTSVLVPFLMIWGAAVIADSGVFSTSLSEAVDARFVGTALTAQTATGFLVTVLTIHVVPIIADATGWQYAFLLLAPGPLLGAVAMSTARESVRHPPTMEEHDDHEPNAHHAFRRADCGALSNGR